MKISLNPSRLLLLTTTMAMALLFTFAITTAALAKGGNQQSKTFKSNDQRIWIHQVDPATHTVVFHYMQDRSICTFKITPTTAITVNDHPGTIADIKVGMLVKSSTEGDGLTLSSISVETVTPPPVNP